MGKEHNNGGCCCCCSGGASGGQQGDGDDHGRSAPCKRMKVTIDSIYIKKSECYGWLSEPGSSAEWKLLITVNGQTVVWENNDVRDDYTYYLNRELYVDIENEFTNIVVSTSGVEKDDTSADDALPSSGYTHGSADNWGIGATRKLTASSDCFDYTVHYTIKCLSADQYSTIERAAAVQITRDWATSVGANAPASDNEVLEFFANRIRAKRAIQLTQLNDTELVFRGPENVRNAAAVIFAATPPLPPPPPVGGPPSYPQY